MLEKDSWWLKTCHSSSELPQSKDTCPDLGCLLLFLKFGVKDHCILTDSLRAVAKPATVPEQLIIHSTYLRNAF